MQFRLEPTHEENKNWGLNLELPQNFNFLRPLMKGYYTKYNAMQ